MTYWGQRQSIQTAFGGVLAAELKRKKRVKKVANNTYKWTDFTGNVHIRLHRTDILTKKTDGKVIVDDGGFMTRTTKNRINNWLSKFGINATISDAGGVWWVHYKGIALPYWSGMCLPDDLGEPNYEAHKEQIDKRKDNLKLAKGVCKSPNQVTNEIFTNAMQWAGYRGEQLNYVDRTSTRIVNIVKRYLNAKVELVQ